MYCWDVHSMGYNNPSCVPLEPEERRFFFFITEVKINTGSFESNGSLLSKEQVKKKTAENEKRKKSTPESRSASSEFANKKVENSDICDIDHRSSISATKKKALESCGLSWLNISIFSGPRNFFKFRSLICLGMGRSTTSTTKTMPGQSTLPSKVPPRNKGVTRPY